MHEAAQRILDEIEGALASPSHDDIVRQSLRAQFLVEHGHVDESDAHDTIWRALEASGYLATHERKEVRRALRWAREAVADKIMQGEDVDELADVMSLEWELDAFEDEEGERPSKLVPVPAKPPSFDGRLVTVDEIGEARKLEWWARPFLPKGHLVLLAGEGGIGKGLLSISFTIDVVNAGGRVLWLSVEDDKDTIKSRLVAAGCTNCGDVVYGEKFHADEIEPLIHHTGADVVFLDAGRDYMRKPKGGGSNNDDDSIRPGLVELRQIAMHTGATIVFIHHSPKSQFRADGSVKGGTERILGGTSFKDVPRFVLLLARNGDNEIAVGLVKANKTRRDVGYMVEVHDYLPEGGDALDDVLDDDEDREVFLVRSTERFDNFDEWLTKKPKAAGPINRDEEVLELYRGLETRAIPGPDKMAALHQEDTGLTTADFKRANTRLHSAGTIIYNDKRRSWYLTED